jgi:hypothetical protein
MPLVRPYFFSSLKIFKEIAEIVSINPLTPQSWGTFKSRGTPPDPRQEVSCTSFSAVS